MTGHRQDTKAPRTTTDSATTENTEDTESFMKRFSVCSARSVVQLKNDDGFCNHGKHIKTTEHPEYTESFMEEFSVCSAYSVVQLLFAVLGVLVTWW
jgi:hypothetical protein